MSVYIKHQIINDLIMEANNMYLDCLENNTSVPSIIQFFNDEYHMRYKLNRLLINDNISSLDIYYFKFLLSTFPEGFGIFFIKSLNDDNINLTDIYYDLKKISYNKV